MFELGDVGDALFSCKFVLFGGNTEKCSPDGGRTGEVTSLGIRDLVDDSELLSSLKTVTQNVIHRMNRGFHIRPIDHCRRFKRVRVELQSEMNVFSYSSTNKYQFLDKLLPLRIYMAAYTTYSTQKTREPRTTFISYIIPLENLRLLPFNKKEGKKIFLHPACPQS